MGMQGPLTAQALGRSPYDDLEKDDREDDVPGPANESPDHVQQYDSRGRPVNPETKRVNRSIIRSHNEVMLVIGVAEQENQGLSPEAEAERRHEAYEDSIGIKLASWAHECIETVGLFGVNGYRQRILLYKQYSEVPCWRLYDYIRRDVSPVRDILPGAPTSWFTNYVDRRVARLRRAQFNIYIKPEILANIWSFARTHLELYVALQRLGLVGNTYLLPGLSFFIPFSATSPIPRPPPLQDLSLPSVARWLGGVAISTAPFLVWALQQKMRRDIKPDIWRAIFRRLPNTGFHAKRYIPSHRPTTWVFDEDSDADADRDASSARQATEPHSARDAGADVSPLRAVDGEIPTESGPVEAVRRPSTYSNRGGGGGDDYATDEEEPEGLSATLISFDVEATESSDVPPGLWSAELRPSVAPDGRNPASAQPVYSDSMLTQLPPLVSSHIWTDAVGRIIMAPAEATALRMVGRVFRQRLGLPCSDMWDVGFFSNFSLTSLVNLLGVEFIHLMFSMEVWAAFTMISQYYRMSPEEWKRAEEKTPDRLTG